ncbi:MAG: SMC-Scp complex subunit ScpB [bacterium]|nr:SMC-Scp complex subunit ScpB [Gammaproteobacteria bacterium]HIL96071.1 SMC-Scp complex subunit ScpB [Pseudomonadales bacterium]
MSEIPALKQILEGAILAADKPLSIDILIQLFDGEQPSRADVKEVLAQISDDCDGRGFELKKVASGYRFQVRSEFGSWVDRLWQEKPPRYTRAFLETLALIAYKQPITRGDIEEIRGVSVSTNIMRSLLEREWIRIVGHRDVPGRPAIYATTRTFLDYFDLSSLDELPTLSEIKDLDKMNEELDLGAEDLIQPRTLDLVSDDEHDQTEADDATLQEVTDRVNTIQQNIKNLFKVEESGEIDDEALEQDDESSTEESNSIKVPDIAAATPTHQAAVDETGGADEKLTTPDDPISPDV